MLDLRIYISLMFFVDAYMAFPRTYEGSLVSWKSTGTSVFDFNIRLLGRERKANGSLTLKEDIDDKHFTMEAVSFVDSNGSGNYKRMAISLAKKPMCEAIKTYWDYFEGTLKYGVTTNCPFVNRTCPLPKGHYYIKDMSINTDDWPAVMPRGYLKGIITFKKDSKVVSEQELVVHVMDRPF
ncbi:uncharacterized protein LOC108052703 [Drosophila rhopaloa]|uniref:Uncharacterized protein LOC108052703 n=1 Tax=Drosophila rhopaloa TaxID=1041015 RepID=A0A6P4FJF4_DRORH|nr:uncharacterized protein LOC108052703 [Drosophila rhopaloa]